MKRSFWVFAALVTLSTYPLMAQQAGAGAQQGASGSAAGTSANQSSAASAGARRDGKSAEAQGSGSAAGSASMPMRPVNGELVGKLDSKSSKVGDPVVVKTTEAMRTADGTEIPKGSRIMGHVTDVQAHSKEQPDSHLAVEFDHAVMKDGRSIPIHSMVESVAPSPAAIAAASRDDGDSPNAPGAGLGHMSSAGRSGGLGGAPLGAAGGLAGGAAGGAAGGLGSATGAAGSTLGGSTLGSTANATGNLAGDATATTGAVSGVGSGAGSLAAHATAVPGVMLAGDATGATSGMFSASRRNVHLDSGTLVLLGVATAVSQ